MLDKLWPAQVDQVPLGTRPSAPPVLHLPAQSTPTAPPVLLIHGFRGTAAEWGPLAERLSATRDVWAPDIVATSHDEQSGLRDVHDQLDAVRAVAATRAGACDSAAPDHAVDVIASSMGGFIATSWASRRGDAVGRMTLLAPALVPLQPLWKVPGFMRLIGLQAALDGDESRWERELTTATVTDFFARESPQHLAVPVEWREAILSHHRAGVLAPTSEPRRCARQGVVRALMSTLRRRGSVARMLAAVTGPVLWLHGDVDPLVPFRPSRSVSGAIPDCTFVPLAGVGHIPHLECPDLVIRHLEQWESTGGAVTRTRP